MKLLDVLPSNLVVKVAVCVNSRDYTKLLASLVELLLQDTYENAKIQCFEVLDLLSGKVSLGDLQKAVEVLVSILVDGNECVAELIIKLVKAERV